MSRPHQVPVLRERVSDVLFRVGVENAIDRAGLEESISATEARSRSRSAATQALVPARWADAAILWLSWRLRPRHIAVR